MDTQEQPGVACCIYGV